MPPTTQRQQDTKVLLDFLKSWNKMPNEQEIKSLIEAVLRYSQEMHGKTSAEVKKILSEIQNIGSQVMQKHDSSLAQHKTALSDTQAQFLQGMEQVIKDRLATLKDGKDGMPGEMGLPAANGSPDTGVEIRNKLEHLTGEDRLDVSAIKGLDERLKKVENKPASVFGGAMNYATVDLHIVDDETPTGTVNGVNTDFVLNGVPSPAASLKVYRGGARQRITQDYTLSGQTITFTVPPVSGEVILCDYRI